VGLLVPEDRVLPAQPVEGLEGHRRYERVRVAEVRVAGVDGHWHASSRETPCSRDDNSYYVDMAQATIGEDQAPATTRDRILAAAAEVFAERGDEGGAVSDIARRAGFTTGAIYGRFRDKAELLLEVVRGVLESQQEAAVMAASTASVEENGVSSRFAELVGEFVDANRA